MSPTSPVIGLVPTADEQGYWLIGSDGGIFAFGDAPFVGSLPGARNPRHRHRRSSADDPVNGWGTVGVGLMGRQS